LMVERFFWGVILPSVRYLKSGHTRLIRYEKFRITEMFIVFFVLISVIKKFTRREKDGHRKFLQSLVLLPTS